VKQKGRRVIVKHTIEKNLKGTKSVAASANTTDCNESCEQTVIDDEHDVTCMEMLTTNSRDVLIEQLHQRIAQLEKELELQQRPRKAVHRPAILLLLCNDKQVKFYTGLPSKAHFDLLGDYIEPKMAKG